MYERVARATQCQRCSRSSPNSPPAQTQRLTTVDRDLQFPVSSAIHAFIAPSAKRTGAVKRADRIAGFDRWTSLGLRSVMAPSSAGCGLGTTDHLPVWPGDPLTCTDLVFSRSLYVDMIPAEVPVRWGCLSSAVS
jgi:hypothetical protein